MLVWGRMQGRALEPLPAMQAGGNTADLTTMPTGSGPSPLLRGQAVPVPHTWGTAQVEVA